MADPNHRMCSKRSGSWPLVPQPALPGRDIQTAPDHFLGDFPRFKWLEIAPHIPEDLKGWRVLDIGCNAGFYSFEWPAAAPGSPAST